MLASLGCGNPTALAKLNPGEVVLDLGSGGGIDVLLSAKRVGVTGKAYGLDMTDEMLGLPERNKTKGSGGGIDVLLSAKRVGVTGKAYGLDMTDEMLGLANENKQKSGLDNVEFLK